MVNAPDLGEYSRNASIIGPRDGAACPSSRHLNRMTEIDPMAEALQLARSGGAPCRQPQDRGRRRAGPAPGHFHRRRGQPAGGRSGLQTGPRLHGKGLELGSVLRRRADRLLPVAVRAARLHERGAGRRTDRPHCLRWTGRHDQRAGTADQCPALGHLLPPGPGHVGPERDSRKHTVAGHGQLRLEPAAGGHHASRCPSDSPRGPCARQSGRPDRDAGGGRPAVRPEGRQQCGRELRGLGRSFREGGGEPPDVSTTGAPWCPAPTRRCAGRPG